MERVVDDILVSPLLCREDHIYLAITCTTSNSHKRLSFPGPEIDCNPCNAMVAMFSSDEGGIGNQQMKERRACTMLNHY